MSRDAHHVVPAPTGGWSVRKGGTSRASKHFATKTAAASWARRLSRDLGSDLVIHKKDGTIERKDSHGRHPLPARARR